MKTRYSALFGAIVGATLCSTIALSQNSPTSNQGVPVGNALQALEYLTSANSYTGTSLRVTSGRANVVPPFATSGHLNFANAGGVFAMPLPTYSAGGGGGATISGSDGGATDTSFTVLTSSTTSTNVTVAFGQPFKQAPICYASPQQTSQGAVAVTTTASAVEILWTTTEVSLKFNVFCQGL